MQDSLNTFNEDLTSSILISFTLELINLIWDPDLPLGKGRKSHRLL